MTATNGKTEEGELGLRVFNEVGQYVRLHMVNANERYVERQCQRFGKLGANQQRTDEARRLGKGNGAYRLQHGVYGGFVYVFTCLHGRFLQGGIYDRHYVLHMGAG